MGADTKTSFSPPLSVGESPSKQKTSASLIPTEPPVFLDRFPGRFHCLLRFLGREIVLSAERSEASSAYTWSVMLIVSLTRRTPALHPNR
jgi:hypothetical protein